MTEKEQVMQEYRKFITDYGLPDPDGLDDKLEMVVDRLLEVDSTGGDPISGMASFIFGYAKRGGKKDESK